MSRQHSRSTNSGPSQRQLRVGEMLRHALADVLRRGDLRDPDLAGVSVTITQVKPSAKTIVAALNRHKGYLRGEMGHLITLKFTPELRFLEDESFAEAQKIESLLKSPVVQRDLSPPDSEDSKD
jgi:ribosome-binding factor A